MELGITGKTAIITGASTGIGFAVAREFAENGARVVLVARTADRLHQAAKEIMQECKSEVLAVPADVSDPAEPDRIVHSARARFGSVDIMINNAGRAHSGDILQATDADWEEMTATKLSAMRRFCRAVIPDMRERHWGRIVNISSIGGIYPHCCPATSGTKSIGCLYRLSRYRNRMSEVPVKWGFSRTELG
jgi:3-oxoacyl-[acyl-carrier protein] reductase